MVGDLIGRLIDFIKEYKKQKYIKKLEAKGLKIGKNVAIVGDFFFDPAHCFLITIEDNVNLAHGIRLIAHDASTKAGLGYTRIGPIHIEEGCSIGENVSILPSVRIGKGSLIGTGSVITNDIPPGSVASGAPAKVMTTVEEFHKRQSQIAEESRVFDDSYHIWNITPEKQKEMLAYLEKNKRAFIV